MTLQEWAHWATIAGSAVAALSVLAGTMRLVFAAGQVQRDVHALAEAIPEIRSVAKEQGDKLTDLSVAIAETQRDVQHIREMLPTMGRRATDRGPEMAA